MRTDRRLGHRDTCSSSNSNSQKLWSVTSHGYRKNCLEKHIVSDLNYHVRSIPFSPLQINHWGNRMSMGLSGTLGNGNDPHEEVIWGTISRRNIFPQTSHCSQQITIFYSESCPILSYAHVMWLLNIRGEIHLLLGQVLWVEWFTSYHLFVTLLLARVQQQRNYH